MFVGAICYTLIIHMSGHIHIEAFEGRLGSSFRARTLTVLLLKILLLGHWSIAILSLKLNLFVLLCIP